MAHEKNFVRYYLFSFANLIAAFGGGLILGKGISVINYPYLRGGSILAFFIGTILGLIFLHSIPKKWSHSFAKYFSIGCSITSLILLYIYKNNSSNEELYGLSALFFFIFLSIRFGFWFYSRVMRASRASSSQQSVAWVEMGYYLGMVLGLIMWKLLNFSIGLSSALLLDASLQFIAGLLDFTCTKRGEPLSGDNNNNDNTITLKPHHYSLEWCWRLSGAVVILTIAIQVILFNAAHHVPESLGSYIIALFYFGVASAAFFCDRYKLFLSWDNQYSVACIHSGIRQKIKIKLSLLLFISVSSVLFVTGHMGFNQSSYFILLFVFIAAFIFEIISIAILDRIGLEERHLNYSGMIMRTYGLMGVGAAFGFWMLGFMNSMVESSAILLSICFFLLQKNITKRINQPRTIAII